MLNIIALLSLDSILALRFNDDVHEPDIDERQELRGHKYRVLGGITSMLKHYRLTRNPHNRSDEPSRNTLLKPAMRKLFGFCT